MARPASPHPTDGELEILRVLWDQGPLGLGEICAELRQQRQVATTTVATMLRLMFDKKLVRRNRSGRTSQWSAAVSRQKATGSLVSKLVDRVFDGSAQQLVAHLIEADELSDRDLAELRQLLNKKGRTSTKGKGGTSR